MSFFRFLLVCLLFANHALAQDLQGKFQDWSVFKANRGDKVLCYIMSLPIKSVKRQGKVGESFLVITDVENDADEVSVSSGVNYHDKSNVELSFGAKKYDLLPNKSRAWAYDKNDDIEIIKQMQQNSDLVVSAISDIDENLSDTYSLIGFSDAYSKMKEVCNNK
jgi:hypothetical protein